MKEPTLESHQSAQADEIIQEDAEEPETPSMTEEELDAKLKAFAGAMGELDD